MRTSDPLINELAAPADRYTCQLDRALAAVGPERRTAILEAITTGPRGVRRLARLLAEHGVAVSEHTLHRHRYGAGCSVCGGTGQVQR